MNVLLAPYFEGNQYLRLLESELQERDVTTFRETRSHPLWPFLLDAIRYDIDVLHLHWTHPYFMLGDHGDFRRLPFTGVLSTIFALGFLIQVSLCSILCSRVVWTVHNRANHERRNERLDKWVSRRLLAIVDIVQVWDERTKEELEEYLGYPITDWTAIPHGNYSPLYSVDEYAKSEARSELSIDNDKRTFLYFGRIRPYKQVPELLKAWRETDPSNAQLLVAGNSKSATLTEEIVALADTRNDVHLDLRYIPDEQVPIYFAACDIAVFPYRSIFNSGSVLLAMSFGRPFLAPQMGAIPGVDPGGNLLYDSDGEGLRSAIRDGLNIPDDELEEVGSRNRLVAEERYDWEPIVDDLIEMYRRRNARE